MTISNGGQLLKNEMIPGYPDDTYIGKLLRHPGTGQLCRRPNKIKLTFTGGEEYTESTYFRQGHWSNGVQTGSNVDRTIWYHTIRPDPDNQDTWYDVVTEWVWDSYDETPSSTFSRSYVGPHELIVPEVEDNLYRLTIPNAVYGTSRMNPDGFYGEKEIIIQRLGEYPGEVFSNKYEISIGPAMWNPEENVNRAISSNLYGAYALHSNGSVNFTSSLIDDTPWYNGTPMGKVVNSDVMTFDNFTVSVIT